MFIKSIRIENYKCFDKTEHIQLSKGINLILGKNNVGKTAFLEAVSVDFTPNSYRNFNSDRPLTTDVISNVEVELQLESDEFINFALAMGQRKFSSQIPHAKQNWQVTFDKKIFSSLQPIKLFFKKNANEAASALLKTTIDIFGATEFELTNSSSQHFTILSRGESYTANWNGEGHQNPNIFSFVAERARQRIYRFKAERLNLSRSPAQVNTALQNDARNLAGSLQQLMSQPSQYGKLCELVQEIFPDICSVVVKNPSPTECEIFIWPVHPNTERESALISLAECGTGVAQILAILYVVISSKQSRVIIIDEPNSFLHPGAAKKLIEILKRYPQHQYIISTHASEIIKIANASNILMLSREGNITEIKPIEPDNLQDMKAALIEMGSSMSDVFGADSILWVEGETEEECFKILADAWGDLPLGITILKVKHTGDFEDKSRKDPRVIWEIYKKLSISSNALMPPAVGFIFDRENRTEKDQESLKKDSKDTVRFLSRRMFENYLLHPEAIAATLNSLPAMKNNSTNGQDVQKWLLKNGGGRQFIDKEKNLTTLDDPEWLKEVHGANLLEALFQEFAKTEFKKTRDCPRLTKWLAENQKESFEEIHEIVKKMTYPEKKAVQKAA